MIEKAFFECYCINNFSVFDDLWCYGVAEFSLEMLFLKKTALLKQI